MDWDAATIISVGPPDELIAGSAVELGASLRSQPELGSEFHAYLARKIPAQLDAETWDQLRKQVTDTLGAGPGGLVMWASYIDPSEDDRAQRLALLNAIAEPAVVAFLHRIRTAYGTDFQAAWEVYGELPNNWKTVNRDIYVDVVRGRPYIKFTMLKFNGEQVLVEGTGDSFLNLAAYLSAALTTLGDPSFFTQDIIDYYTANASALLTMFHPPEDPAAPEAAPN